MIKNSKISGLLKLFATGTFSVLMAACYGPPVRTLGFSVTNEDDDTIPELKVSLVDGDSQTINTDYTDTNGYFELPYPGFEGLDSHRIIIKDIDGPDNLGEYGITEINPAEQTSDVIILDEE